MNNLVQGVKQACPHCKNTTKLFYISPMVSAHTNDSIQIDKQKCLPSEIVPVLFTDGDVTEASYNQ